MNAPVTVYVSRDSAAKSVGADEVADALLRAADRIGQPIRLVRNGSRGMLWLEPIKVVAPPVGPRGAGPAPPAQESHRRPSELVAGCEYPLRGGRVSRTP